MNLESDLNIERMSVQEIRKIIDDLNDKNQMLENHLNIMKKCFQTVVKLHSFLAKMSLKLNDYITEEESKQLSDFQKSLSEMSQGHISTHILMDAMGGSSDAVSIDTSNSNANTTQKKSVNYPYVCPHKHCNQLFKTKREVDNHSNKCLKYSKRTVSMSCDSSEAESRQSTRLLNRITAKKAINVKQKKKMLKMKSKTNEKIDTSCQTPFSSALMSLALESDEIRAKSKSLNESSINGQKTFVCNYPECGHRVSSLMQMFEHRMSSHSVYDSEDLNQKKSATNEELIVSHITDSNESFGEWMDATSDLYFKCSESSCGQLFPENIDLLRHMETTHSSDMVLDPNQNQFQLKTEPELFEEFEIKEIFDSNQLLSMDQFVGQVSNSIVNSITFQNKTTNERPFKLPLDSNNEPESLTIDSNESLVKCSEDLCEMTFEDDMDLIIHLKTVHNKKVKKCTFSSCSFLYENRNLLWVHLKECHKGQQMPFKCNHLSCNNAFLTEADLNRHITSFHAVDRHSSISGIFISDTLSNCQSVKRKKS